MNPNTTVFRARYLLPMDRPPILDGTLVVSDGLIRQVTAWSPKQVADIDSHRCVDLGDVALIPALVNAHTHLEFSHFQQPLGYPGIPFVDWIRLVVAARTRQNIQDCPIEEAVSSRARTRPCKLNSIRRGLAESFRSGVGCLGEIGTDPTDLSDYRCHQQTNGLDVTVFLEQLGRQLNALPKRKHELDQFLTNAADSPLQRGVSPHAPYSVHPQLLQQMLETAIATRSPIAMHLAESEAELELLDRQTGPFADLLKDFGLWDPASFLPQQSILELLKQLARCERSMIIHGNYLTEQEIQFLGLNRKRMSVVFCPRTHEFFQHAPYPLLQMRRAGVAIAIGTDSRASNPDLNLFAELQIVQHRFPTLSPLEVLELGTQAGARALGQEHRLGTLSPGKCARLSVLHAPVASLPRDSGEWDWLMHAQPARLSVQHPLKQD